MNSLASRKQLLIAESELNRAQLVYESQRMAGEVHALVRQAKTIGTIASAAATLVAGLASCLRKTPPPAPAKHSWGQTLVKVAGLVATFWSEFRSSRREEKKP
jgi:hypothetical protein